MSTGEVEERRRFARARFVAALLLICAMVGSARLATAATAAGTTISNSSSATYSDATANAYSANSNIVSIIVQNAPQMSVVASSPTKAVTAGQTVTDVFVITNTGNASGDVQFTAAGVTAGTDQSFAIVSGYSYSGSYTGSGTNYTSLTSLNTALSGAMVPASGTINVSVTYVLNDAATSGGDVQTNLTGTITYAQVNTTPVTPAQTSAAVSATPSYEDDTVGQDALLDVQLTATNAGGIITYVLSAVNRSTVWAARDLAAVKTLLGSSSGGVFVSAKIPQYPSSTPLTISGAPSVVPFPANGFANGATATMYSTASATGAGPWTAGPTPVANATYIGVFITGGNCTNNGVASQPNLEVCPLASGSSPGNVNAKPAVTLTFAVTQSAASGATTAGSTYTIGNSLIGSNGTTEYVIGPGIAAGTLADGSGAAVTASITTTGAGINNTTAINSPSGASNIWSTQSTGSYSVANGPFGSAATAAATGTYDGSTNDNNHDFTAVSFVSTNPSYTTTNTTGTYSPTTTSTTAAVVTNINVENTLANTGNVNDTYTVLATAPTGGWTVALETATAGSPDTPGTSLGTAAAGATSTASNVAVAAGATLNYFAVYTAPASTPYLSHGVGIINATSVGNSAVSNSTVNLLYAGFVALTTTATTTPNCPAGTSPAAGMACSGGTIVYAIDYRNVVNNVDVSSVPSVSFAHVVTKLGTFAITADGTNATVATNNWATMTNGPIAAPIDTTANTTYAYYTGTPAAPSGPTWVAATTKFIATVGGASFQLVPAGYGSGTSQGTITFSVIVK